MSPSIKLENVGVAFDLPHTRSNGLMRSFTSVALGGVISKNKNRVAIKALDNIYLDLKTGDRAALIGHNGAGKTTLLRIMAGIIPPTEGKLRIVGKISSLISIQLGLDSHATGRANIRLRARYMGFSDPEIDRQIENIIAFSDLGGFLDLPLRSYSSGMKLRLSFAIATAFKPDILILDEWLSAGDELFQKKAADRLQSLIENTGIFVFASHNSGIQARICNKGIVLQNGLLKFHGNIEEAIAFNKKLRTEPSKK